MSTAESPGLSICLIERQDCRSGFSRQELDDVLASMPGRHEVVAVSFDASCRAVVGRGCGPHGYRAALARALDQTSGEYLITTDSFLAHDIHFLLNFWAMRDKPDLAIASRFAPGGAYRTGLFRRVAAAGLNVLVRRALSLPYHDLTSAFRMYRRSALREALGLARSRGYDFLAESVVLLHGLGRVIEEVPYVSRRAPSDPINVPGREVALPVLEGLPRLWQLRNSVFSADYDERAFNSLIWPQRYWQRKRFEIITGFVDSPRAVLDIGCGSSKIIQAFPGAIGLDIQLKKLRFLMRRRTRLVQGSAFRLPFGDHRFRTVICSEVIEHIPYDEVLFREFGRVLEPGGVLVVGTPDYGTWAWRGIEAVYGKIMPGGYAHEHITHYSARQLTRLLRGNGFRIEAARRICGAELIVKARKALRGLDS